MAESVKVYFQFEQDDDGYPPAALESVWAQETGRPGELVVDNVPFFTRDATVGDTICVSVNRGRQVRPRMRNIGLRR